MTTNIVPILTHHDNAQPAILHPIDDTDALQQSTLLPDGTPIETLNGQETWTNPKTHEVWVLPKSKKFPDFINKKYGTETYMSTKENFLNQIVHVLKTAGSDTEAPPFPYQNFIRDYLSFGTPYRALLLEHGLGSGKTRSVIMVGKTFRKAGLKTLVLTPAFLRLNFMEELEKWEDPGVDIKAWYKFAHYNATGYRPGTKRAGKDIGGMGGVFDQLAALGIGFSKDDPIYGKMFPYLYQKYKHEIKPPEHMLIVIEEGHNLNRSFINKGTSKVKSLLYPLLMKAKDCKFIILSGTPMVSTPFELAPMYNILRGPLKDGHTAFPSEENAFNSHFVDYVAKDYRNVDIMMSRMVGLGSYFVGITEDKERAIFPARKDHVLNLTTTPYQTWIHDHYLEDELSTMKSKSKKEKLLALPGGSEGQITMTDEQDELTPKGTYHTRSRASCNFVFPVYIPRPRKGKKDFDYLDKYIYEFQLADGSPATTPEHYQTVFDAMISHFDFENDEEESEMMINFEDAKSKTIKDIRIFLSEQFMAYFRDTLQQNNGFPHRIKFHKYLSDTDQLMIDRTVGDYQTRIKIALTDLGVPPPGKPSVFELKALKHHSIKMYAIYKAITENIAAGAPHVVNTGPGSESDSESEPEFNTPKDYEVDITEHKVDDVDPEEVEEIQQSLSTKVKVINDPDDPLKKREFADVFLSDEELKKQGKKVVGGPALVYSYFSTAEGAAIFSMVLEAHGFENFNSSVKGPKELTRRKRFAFFRGGMDQAIKRNILHVFNSKENVNGQLIRVIFVTQAAAEGISLYNLRQIHIMEPHWDNVMIEQVIGRGFRLLASKFIKDPKDREINVFRYFCVRPKVEVLDKWASTHALGDQYYAHFSVIDTTAKMADHMIQEIADKKDTFRLKLKDIRIKVAVDCFLNHKYNKPRDGCFEYHDKQGPAFSSSITEHVTETKETTTDTKEEKIAFVTVKHKKSGTKHYITYPDHKPVKLKFEGKTALYSAIKLYGPIDEIPDNLEDYVIPESALHAGFYHMQSKQFIPIGAGTEVGQ